MALTWSFEQTRI